jgi:Protein of unknown function (DUF3618)
MDSTPDDIRAQIASTRASLDRHLDELETQVDLTKERVKDTVVNNAQYWGGIGAVAAGVLGAIALWPRRRARRSFQRAAI